MKSTMAMRIRKTTVAMQLNSRDQDRVKLMSLSRSMSHRYFYLLTFLLLSILNASAWGGTRNKPVVFAASKHNNALRSMSTTGSGSEQSIRVLGVCGGIGSGKSQACKLLVSDLGCISHIEADTIAHTVYKPGSQAVRDVVDHFGPGILMPGKNQGEEEIDRQKLGSIVFGDSEALSQLERIVWPHVKEEIFSRINAIKEAGTNAKGLQNDAPTPKVPVIVVEAAVLLDAGWEDFLDGVWVVRAPPCVAVKRLVEYRSFTIEDAEKRIEAQSSRRGIGNVDEEFEKGVVDAIIENKGGIEELRNILAETLNDKKSWKKR